MIQVFTKVTHAKEIILYPEVCTQKSYRYGEVLLSGADIKERGILLEQLEQNSCQTIQLSVKK